MSSCSPHPFCSPIGVLSGTGASVRATGPVDGVYADEGRGAVDLMGLVVLPLAYGQHVHLASGSFQRK